MAAAISAGATTAQGDPAALLAAALRGGPVPPSAACEELYGRVCFIYPPGTPLPHLGAGEVAAGTSIDEPPAPHKPICFVTDGAFLQSVATRQQAAALRGHVFGAREILQCLGLEDSLIDAIRQRGASFRLCIFSERELRGAVVPATWGGVRRVAEAVFPDAVVSKLGSHWPILETTGWADLGGASFAELREAHGPMTPAVFATAIDTAENARRLLCDSLYLTEHFSGDGYTVDPRTDQETAREFLAPNLRLSDIPQAQQVVLQL